MTSTRLGYCVDGRCRWGGTGFSSSGCVLRPQYTVEYRYVRCRALFRCRNHCVRVRYIHVASNIQLRLAALAAPPRLESPAVGWTTIRGLGTLLIVAVAASACGSPAPTTSPPPASTQRPHSTATSAEQPPSAIPTSRPTPSSSLAPSPSDLPSPLASGAARTVQSDDGLLTIDVPAGAVADPAALTATAHGQEDLPPELNGLEVRSAFYELAPAGTEFAAPITVTRQVSLDDLQLDQV